MHPIALLQLFLAVMHILSLCWRYNRHVRQKRIQERFKAMARRHVSLKRRECYRQSMMTEYVEQDQLTESIHQDHPGWLFADCRDDRADFHDDYELSILTMRKWCNITSSQPGPTADNGILSYTFFHGDTFRNTTMQFWAPRIAHKRCASLRLAARGMQTWKSSGKTLPIPLILDILDQVISGWVQDVRKHQGAHDAKRRTMLSLLYAQGIPVPKGF